MKFINLFNTFKFTIFVSIWREVRIFILSFLFLFKIILILILDTLIRNMYALIKIHLSLIILLYISILIDHLLFFFRLMHILKEIIEIKSTCCEFLEILMNCLDI